MLSIAKLAAGGQRYYLEQAKAKVDHQRSVASGVEYYYLSGREPAGRWMGSVSERGGYGGELVSEEQLHRALSWADPLTGAELEGPVRHARVPGFDLMFSVPKSASILVGVAGLQVQQAVRDAQAVAVGEAMRYLEETAARTWMGNGGHAVIEGRGLLGAAFEHRTSRAGDPQLHTHVLVANAIERPDGRFGTLDGRALYAESRTAGYIHEAAFRRALTEALGVEWAPARNGIADLSGFDAPLLEEFSRRRQEIKAQIAEWGTNSRAARQSAAVQTRKAKDYGVTPDQLVGEWRERARALGLDEERVRRLIGRAQPVAIDRNARPGIADALAGPRGLTERAAHFTRADVIRAVAERARHAASLDEIEACADAFLADQRIVALRERTAPQRSEVIRLRTGASVATVPQQVRYSTRAMLATEDRIVDTAVARRGAWAAVAAEEHADVAIAARPSIGADQEAMVRRLVGSGDGVDVVVGPAGTGKTFALDAAREAWEASGFRLIGASVARSAARNLQDSTGIQSASVASLLEDLRRGGPFGLGVRTIVIVDEAGMLGTRQLAELVDRTATAQAKLVLVGDHRQLPEIDAGGGLQALASRLSPIELTENRRQTREVDRAKVDHLRHGRVAEALTIAAEQGDVVLAPSADALRDRLVDDYLEARRTGGDALMIALRRVDVADLNQRARARRAAAGELGREAVVVDGRGRCGRAATQRPSARARQRDSRRRGPGRFKRGALDVETVGGETLQLDSEYLQSRTARNGLTVEHGYATTAHVAQGLATDQSFVLGSDEVYAE
ncbi:MAG TPA: MobF family relaxase [Solirubrobacteraceae bacterium]|jgi:conjugative relaxase-like TrwC/TraI family protein